MSPGGQILMSLDANGPRVGGLTSTSHPIRPILDQCLGDARGQLQRRFIQGRGGTSLAGPQHPCVDQPFPDPLVVAVRGGRHQPRDRRTPIEDLNLATVSNFPEVAREVRLQVGDGHGSHDDQCDLCIRTIQVMCRNRDRIEGGAV